MRGEPLRVVVLGGTGTAGRGAVRGLLRAGHQVTCLVRRSLRDTDRPSGQVAVRKCDVTNPLALRHELERGFDALVSCLASRTGVPADAWAIDHRANASAFAAAKDAGVRHVVLVSAICVQRPRLAFQHAKLAAEGDLKASGLRYSIVRPTAFFKSLSGQEERVRKGKPFLVFGDGTLTACKPISDDDLGDYIASCLSDESRWNRVLPIGGPGQAITPLDQGRMLCEAFGREPRVRHVSPKMLSGAARVLDGFARLAPSLATKAELARIGHYYATESMLLLDTETGHYSAEATPSFGTQTLREHYRALASGAAVNERGEHAVFG